MAVVSSAASANDEQKRRRSSRVPGNEALLPLTTSPKGPPEEQQADLSLHLRKQFAQSHDRKDDRKVSIEGWRSLASSEEDEVSPRAYEMALYDSDSGLQHTPPSGYMYSCRRSIRRLLDRPESSTAASVLQVAIMGLIIISTILAVFETVPSLYQEHIDMFKLSEKVFTAIFTAEVLLRAASTESCRNYICAVSNQIDILATSPWYLEKILVATMPTGHSEHLNNIAGSLRTLRMVRLARMVRLVRVLRIAKFARHSEVLSVVVESLVESISGIWVLVAFVSMWALISATVVYAVESEQPDTDFDSIPAAMWWSMATISTVGYGDMVPETAAGKVVGGASMLGGILITSIAVAVITTTFTEHYQDKCRMREAMKLDRIQGREDEEGPGPNGTPPPQSSRRDADNPIVAWDLMEKDVLKHIIRLEAELLDRPLRERNTSNTMAIQMLEEQAKNFFKQGKSLTQQVMMEKVSRITDGELAEEPPGERGESKASIISSV